MGGSLISLALRVVEPPVQSVRREGRASEEAPTKLGSVPQPPPPAMRRGRRAEAAKPPRGARRKAAKAAERPRFEFYQILPGDKEVTDKEARAAAKAPAPPPQPVGPPKPGSSPASPKAHSGEVYWLQAGAFSEEKEADNLKAKIAFTGLEATVRAVVIPDKGTCTRTAGAPEPGRRKPQQTVLRRMASARPSPPQTKPRPRKGTSCKFAAFQPSSPSSASPRSRKA